MMKYLVLFGILGANAPLVEINLSSQKIGSWNIYRIVENELIDKKCDDSANRFILVLSDNYMDDEAAARLMNLLTDDNFRFGKNLAELNLSNNRITPEGQRMFIPLLQSENFQKFNWLNISINIQEYNNSRKFLEELKKFISNEQKQIEAAQKVVFLPDGYDAENFFEPEHPFFKAHNWYYGVEEEKLSLN